MKVIRSEMVFVLSLPRELSSEEIEALHHATGRHTEILRVDETQHLDFTAGTNEVWHDHVFGLTVFTNDVDVLNVARRDAEAFVATLEE